MKCCQLLEIRHKCSEGASLEGKEVRNTIVLTFAFQVVFTGFNALQNLHSSLHDEDSLGNICLAIMSGTAIISSVLSPTIIGLIGAKASIVTFFAAHCIYVVANYYPSFATMGPAAVAVGAFQGPAWTSQALYISASAFSFSKSSSASPYSILSRFNAFFFAVYATSQIVGNLVTSTVIKDGVGNSSDDSVIYRYCGSNDCPAIANATVIEDPEDWVIDITLGFFLACTLLGLLMVIVLLSPLPRSEWIQRVSVRSTTISCFNVLVTTKMILLVPFIFFTAMSNGFLLSTYTKSYVACPIGIHMVGYVMAVYGVTTPVFVFIFSRLSRIAGRFILLTLSLITHTILFIVLFVWTPTADSEAAIFIIPAVWACLRVFFQHKQIVTLIAMLFPSQKEPAFANFHAWRSLGYAITFLNASYMCVSSKLIGCMTFASVGTVLYILVELRTRVKEKLALQRPRQSIASVTSEAENRQETTAASIPSNRSSYSSFQSLQDHLSYEGVELADIIKEAEQGWKRNEHGLTLEIGKVMSMEHLAISKVTNWYHNIPAQSDYAKKARRHLSSRSTGLPRSFSDGHLNYAAEKVDAALFKVRRGRSHTVNTQTVKAQTVAPPLPKRRHVSDINPPTFHIIRDIVYEEDETEIDSELPDQITKHGSDDVLTPDGDDQDHNDDIDENESREIMDYRSVLRRLSETINKDSGNNKIQKETEDTISEESLSYSTEDVSTAHDESGDQRYHRRIVFTLGSTSVNSQYNNGFESDDTDSPSVFHNSSYTATGPKLHRSISLDTGSSVRYENGEISIVANGAHNNIKLTSETQHTKERRSGVINMFKGLRRARTISKGEDSNSSTNSSHHIHGNKVNGETYDSDADSEGFVNSENVDNEQYLPNYVNSNGTLKRKGKIPINETEDVTCIY